ncbi:Protein CBG00459 [Caenorhabditis briggsae]|uniref:Uncharacterized protein n=2 Tax=Caenorhabditis briggsae TaxID=6238 RepID=A0AAE9A782_CAEBR|nr:Protein CBG00459 [Caenorhabditis briggsae]ULT92888.1 hypothetical protein L3Y34_002816 [Caenorhabditis briggsae]ULU09119.1 hypothetical protein L3Y34_013908 [Caenorhabditis briggsae]CAP21907.1 Protein CBG00459 [Caenorhabditis briggsae]
MEMVFLFNPLTEKANNLDHKNLIRDYLKNGKISGLFVPGQLISIVVQSETEPTLEWLGNLGHAETFVIPSESPLTMIRKGRGRIIVDAVTNEHVLDPNGVSISPKLSIIFRTSSSVSEMIVLNGKKILIAERRLKNADEIVLWKSDVKLLSCYHVTFFNEETELEVVDITKVEEREALLTLHRLSARNHQETAEQEVTYFTCPNYYSCPKSMHVAAEKSAILSKFSAATCIDFGRE